MKRLFTVTVKKPGWPDGRVFYEGEFERTAERQFAKATRDFPAGGGTFLVALNDRVVYTGRVIAEAKKKTADLVEQVTGRKGSTATVRFQVQAGELTATWAMRPWEERLHGGSPQVGL